MIGTIVAKKDVKSSKSVKLMGAETVQCSRPECSFAALFSLLQLQIASVLVQS